jgi:hypothetical protein
LLFINGSGIAELKRPDNKGFQTKTLFETLSTSFPLSNILREAKSLIYAFIEEEKHCDSAEFTTAPDALGITRLSMEVPPAQGAKLNAGKR